MAYYQLQLPEPAPDWLEALVASEPCPSHPGTSTEAGCELCRLNELAAREAPEAYEA